MMKWLVLLSFFFSPVFAAESCSDQINQNEAVNLENARSQDTVGWCYAYAAADLVSYRLKKRVSAVGLYSSFDSSLNVVPIENEIKTEWGNGGDMSFAINTSKKNGGFCLEAELPSDDFMFCSQANYSEFLKNFITAVREDRYLNNQCLEGSFYSVFPMLNFSDVAKLVQTKGKEKLIENLMKLQCKMPMKSQNISAVNMKLPNHPIEKQMAKLDMLITNGEVSGLMVNYKKLTGDYRDYDHAMLVVGRRKNPSTGECEYLLRNSFGKECGVAETEDLKCHKSCDQKNECRYSGHMWVGKKRLEAAMFGITYLL